MAANAWSSGLCLRLHGSNLRKGWGWLDPAESEWVASSKQRGVGLLGQCSMKVLNGDKSTV